MQQEYEEMKEEKEERGENVQSWQNENEAVKKMWTEDGKYEL